MVGLNLKFIVSVVSLNKSQASVVDALLLGPGLVCPHVFCLALDILVLVFSRDNLFGRLLPSNREGSPVLGEPQPVPPPAIVLHLVCVPVLTQVRPCFPLCSLSHTQWFS